MTLKNPVHLILVSGLVAVLSALGHSAEAGRSLSLAHTPPRLEGQELSTDALFARIDSLEVVLEALEGQDRAAAAQRLGELYLSTDLMKHRRLALDLLAEAARLDPNRMDAALLRAQTIQRMRYTNDAKDEFEAMTQAHPRDPRSWSHLGRFHFVEARRRFEVDRFGEACSAFARSVEVDSTWVAGWYGLAAGNLARQQYEEALRAARRLMQLDTAPQRAEFLMAASLVALDRGDSAQALFERAIASSDERIRDVYESVETFVDEKNLEELAERHLSEDVLIEGMRREDDDFRDGDDIDVKKALRDSVVRAETLVHFWRQYDNRPTQLYNPRRLLYWQRLVEADVLFGDAETDRFGYETAMGEAYVRWGRPTSVWYEAGTWGSILDELDVEGARLPTFENIPWQTPIMVWTYRSPGVWFSLMFTDEARNANWRAGRKSSFRMANLSRAEPLTFFEASSSPAPFTVAFSSSVFHRRPGDPVLETCIGVRPLPELMDGFVEAGDSMALARDDSIAIVDWAILDEENNRVDYRREVLRTRDARWSLHGGLGRAEPARPRDPLLLPIGAILSPGSYRVAIEVSTPGGAREIAVLDVEVPAGPPSTVLAMSQLQLASAFVPYRSGMSIPLRFVKYGHAVVPIPDQRVPGNARRLAVYFEVYNLAVDTQGQTQFDVSYEVFASEGELRGLAGMGAFDRDELERIEPLTMTFLEERTGVAPAGYVVKGTELDISSLESGDFVLVVTVQDRIGETRVSRATGFRKRGS